MNHPKMQYTYVGIDSHKDTHTAVFIDCFFEKLGEVQFNNRPSCFDEFLLQAQTYLMPDTCFMFGLEDVSSYGRTLMVFLKSKGQQVKHVNALLVARERKNQNIVQKSDSIDAECAARVLLAKFGELPNAEQQDMHWILRSLVTRREFLVKHKAATKTQLHSLLTQHYPNYRSFFASVDCNAGLAFFMRYPSPSALEGTAIDELATFLWEESKGQFGADKAQHILSSLEDTTVQFQDVRDMVVQSAIRQIRYNMEEIERLDTSLASFMAKFDCTLTSIAGIDTVTAATMLALIGDIKNFSSPAKLARYAGIAPVTYASGKKDLQFANQRGNRKLNSVFYILALRLTIAIGPTQKVLNSFFYDYYRRKLGEGKTKRQALKCVQRRLVNIVWTMLTNGEEYVNPPMFDLPQAMVDDVATH